MPSIHRFHRTMLGLAAVVSIVVVAPTSAQKTEDVFTIAPASSVLDRRAVTAQQALQAGDLGSLQEEAMIAIVSANTSPLDIRDANTVTARRVLVAQHALTSNDLGSLQEEALTALVDAAGASGGR